MTCKPCLPFLRARSKTSPLGRTQEEECTGRAPLFWSEAPGGACWVSVVSFFTWNWWQHWVKDGCLFCFQQKYPSLWELWQAMYFSTQGHVALAQLCTQPPVPTSACVLHWLTSFQASREESSVAQGSAAAAATNSQGQRREETQMMCRGHEFHF